MDFGAFSRRLFELDPAIRWVAVGSAGDPPTTAYRSGVTPLNAEETDEAETRVVNPAVLAIAEARGDWDLDGLEFVVVAYGRVTQVVMRLPAGGHLTVSLQRSADAYDLAKKIQSVAREYASGDGDGGDE
jgi:hypothetical protein